MAGFISERTIEQIRQTADIVSIVNEYTNLTQRGSQYWGCCPFHNEKTPSFTVDPVKKFYHCFGCGVGGDVVKFVMEMEKVSYPDALTELAKRLNIEIVYEGGHAPRAEKKDTDTDQILEVYNRIASSFHYILMQTKEGTLGLEYIKGRGITNETLSKFKLGYAPADRHWLKKFLKEKNYSDAFLAKTGLFSSKYPDVCLFSSRLMFPIFDRKGQVVAFSGRTLVGDERKYFNSQELPFFKKRETLFAFNFAKNAIRQAKAAIICEGNMDAIAYHQCGIENAVATLGTALTENHVKLLQGFCDTVLLSFDSDDAGFNATKKAIILCRSFGLTVKVIRLEGGKDPAEIMLKFGAEILTNQVKCAIIDSDFLLSKLKAQFPTESPEDKTRAALAFFPYVDSLNSAIQRESSLEQLAQSFNIAPEAVERDFNDRKQAVARLEAKTSRQDGQTKNQPIRLNAELRAILAVVSNPDEYQVMRRSLTSDDFEDPLARELFISLEECYKKGDVSLSAMLEQCSNEQIQRLITGASATDEFHGNNSQYVHESIQMLKRRGLKRRISKLSERLNNFNPATPDDIKLQNELLSEKMQLDKELNVVKEKKWIKKSLTL